MKITKAKVFGPLLTLFIVIGVLMAGGVAEVSAVEVETPTVVAEDFSTHQSSGVLGYNVGFHLTNATAASTTDITVTLYDADENVLATVTSDQLATGPYSGASVLSTPFDVFGTFDYAADANTWSYSGWGGLKNVVPAKAVIEVTFSDGSVSIAINENLTGEYQAMIDAHYQGVVAEDFSTHQSSGVLGYNVGFHLTNATASSTKSIVVTLYDASDAELAVVTSADLAENYPAASILSAPFDVFGTFDYFADDNTWTYSGWSGNRNIIPAKAVIQVTYMDDSVATAINENLTGEYQIMIDTYYQGVEAEDFSVANNPTIKGYNVGFHLVNAVASSTEEIVVTLYDSDDNVLAIVTSDQLQTNYAGEHILSAPFDLFAGFDYVLDDASTWAYGDGWLTEKNVVPAKAVIEVTFLDGSVSTAVNTLLTGDYVGMIEESYQGVTATDFGVMQFSGVEGYSVGFNLINSTASSTQSITVSLYNEETLLTQNTMTGLATNYPEATSLSTPFDLFGTFDYVADGNWAPGAWFVEKNIIPTHAEITVTFVSGETSTATINGPSGDTEALMSLYVPPVTEEENTGGNNSGSSPRSNSVNGDLNDDDVVNILDFNIMMANWGQTGTGVSGDINRDGVVDILDFNLLIANWTI